jgi:hypothetical protein
MPTDFGDIAAHHRKEAARYHALERAARELGSRAEAEYLATLAARHIEAAQEQKSAMRQGISSSAANQSPRRWPPEPVEQRPPFAALCVLAALRGAERLATAIRQALPKRSARLQGLSLRGSAPRPEPPRPEMLLTPERMRPAVGPPVLLMPRVRQRQMDSAPENRIAKGVSS